MAGQGKEREPICCAPVVMALAGARGHGSLKGGAAASLMFNNMAGRVVAVGPGRGRGPDRAPSYHRNGRESLAEKSIYGLVMEGFWVSDKFRIIAESDTLLEDALGTNLQSHPPFLGRAK
jgi:hypothetical protein